MPNLSFIEHVADVVLRRRLALSGLEDTRTPSTSREISPESYRVLLFLSRLLLNQSAVRNISSLANVRTHDLEQAAAFAVAENSGRDLVYVMDFSEAHAMIHRDDPDPRVDLDGHVIFAFAQDPLRGHRIIVTPATEWEAKNYLYAMAYKLHRCKTAEWPIRSHLTNSTLSRNRYLAVKSGLGELRDSFGTIFSAYDDEEQEILGAELDEPFAQIRNAVYGHLQSVRKKTEDTDAVDAWNVAKVCELNSKIKDRTYCLMTRDKVQELFGIFRLERSPASNADLGIRNDFACSGAAAFYHGETHQNEGHMATKPDSLKDLAETMDYMRRTSSALLDLWEVNRTGRKPEGTDLDALCSFPVDPRTRRMAAYFGKAVARGERIDRTGSEEPLSGRERRKWSIEIKTWARELGVEVETRLLRGRMTSRDEKVWRARKWLGAIGEPDSLLQRQERASAISH